MDTDALDELIRWRVSVLSNNASRYIDWESIAEFEWNLGCAYPIHIKPTDPHQSMYVKFDKQTIMQGMEDNYLCSPHSMLTFMTEFGILIPANYLIVT